MWTVRTAASALAADNLPQGQPVMPQYTNWGGVEDEPMDDDQDEEMEEEEDDVEASERASSASSDGKAESDPLDSEDEQQNPVETHDEDIDLFAPSLEDLVEETRILGRRFRGRRRRRRRRNNQRAARGKVSDVPSYLIPYMTQATRSYMRKDFEDVINMIKHVRAEAPKASGPVRLLAIIEEEKGNKTDSLNLYMEAAELAITDRELWKRNALAWEEAGDIKKAIYCYNRALKWTNMTDSDALYARGMLYLKLNRPRMAGTNFIRLAKLVPDDPHVAKLILKCFKNKRDINRTVEPLEQMLRSCELKSPPNASMDELNRLEMIIAQLNQMLVEVRFDQECFYEASLLLSRQEHRVLRRGMPITFVHRLMTSICHHRLGAEGSAGPTFKEFLDSPSQTAKYPLFLMQIGDACFDIGDYEKSIQAYSRLIELESNSDATNLYLKRSMAYKEKGDKLRAKEDLRNVLKLHPRHVVASLRIVEFLGPNETARGGPQRKKIQRLVPSSANHLNNLEYTTSQTPAQEKKEGEAFLESANSLFAKGNYDHYLAKIYPVFEEAFQLDRRAYLSDDRNQNVSGADNSNNNLEDEENAEDLAMVNELERINEAEMNGGTKDVICTETFENSNGGQSEGNRAKYTYVVHSAMDVELEKRADFMRNISGRNLPMEERIRLHNMGSILIRILTGNTYIATVHRLVKAFAKHNCLGLSHPLVSIFESLSHMRTNSNQVLRCRLKSLDIVSAFAAGKLRRSYEKARMLAHDNPSNASAWEIFSIADQQFTFMSHVSQIRSSRYLNRLVGRHPTNICINIVAGNNAAISGVNNTSYALSRYLSVYEQMPKSSLICLCMAVQLLIMALARTVSNRNETVRQALAMFQEYKRNRLDTPSKISKKWLEMEVDYNIGRAFHQMGLFHMATDYYRKVLDMKLYGRPVPAWADLRRDAAYNLALIYRRNGSPRLAARVLGEFVVF